MQSKLNAILVQASNKALMLVHGPHGFPICTDHVGPCVTAPLIGALIYIADTGDALIGGIALFALSMGMGAPLLAIGTSAGKFLPNSWCLDGYCQSRIRRAVAWL